MSRNILKPALIACLALSAIVLQHAPLCAQMQTFAWPTPFRFNPAKDWAAQGFVQSTAGGEPESGLFGNTRTQGYKFHEGLDIAPVARDAKGEPTDVVRAMLSGRVMVANPQPGRSSYGRFVVLQHGTQPPIYTLYAHLASVSVREGQNMSAGSPLGIMGRSANHTIGKEQAHLHVEIGVRLSGNFEGWYRSKKFGSPNYFGSYNGMNLMGVDPLHIFYTQGNNPPPSLADYFKGLPTAFTVRVPARTSPWFIREHAALLAAPVPSGLSAFDIEFTWWGFPKRWTPIAGNSGLAAGKPHIISFDSKLISRSNRTYIQVRNGSANLTNGGNDLLRLLMGW